MSSKQTYPKKGKKKVLLHTQNACDEACVCVYILLTIQLELRYLKPPSIF